MLILKYIDAADFIESYDYLDYKEWNEGFYYKLRIILKDGSALLATEYVDDLQRNYSFHWQSSDNDIIIRWDNAPHHKELLTFPHHKHIHHKVIESMVVSLEDVLKQIKAALME
ncbi:MAG: hypothetical protein HQK97_06375 [Nitrospirae bacterium]|nr:hypothetical protein [Nitrospirota bacterium]